MPDGHSIPSGATSTPPRLFCLPFRCSVLYYVARNVNSSPTLPIVCRVLYRTVRLACLLSPTLVGCTQQVGIESMALDPCTLVPDTHIESVLQSSVSSTVQPGSGRCIYKSKKNPQHQVHIEVERGTLTAAYVKFNSERLKGETQPVQGIGEDAFTFRSSLGHVHLTFLTRDALVRLVIALPNAPELQGALTRLAQSVASEIIQEMGATRDEVSAGALHGSTGNWYGCLQDGIDYAKGHLVLGGDGSWHLTTAILRSGQLHAVNGRWELRTVDEILHGTYQKREPGMFSTTGILSVDWREVPQAQGPSRFDRGLFKSLQRQRESLVFGIDVARRLSVEPDLLGTWEAGARFMDHEEEFLWIIAARPQSDFYRAKILHGRYETQGDSVQLHLMEGDSPMLVAQPLDEQVLSLTDQTGALYRWTRDDEMLSRC